MNDLFFYDWRDVIIVIIDFVFVIGLFLGVK